MMQFNGKYQHPGYKAVAYIITLALTVSKTLMFQMFDLENLGQGHRVQDS